MAPAPLAPRDPLSSNRQTPRRKPGQHARATVQRLSLRALILLGGLAVGTAYVGRTLGLHDPIFLTFELTLLLAILVVTHSVLPLVARHERGATGEELVGAMLEGLAEDGWSIIHDASFGRGNVDHLLIGPGGVFTVETKSHPGPIVVREIHGATLEQVRSERRAIERIIGEAVEPLVVYSRAWVDRPMARRKGVRIMPARMLSSYLARQPALLSPEEIERAQRRVLAALADSAGARRAPRRPWGVAHLRRGPKLVTRSRRSAQWRAVPSRGRSFRRPGGP
jgi:hypothetical protein